jgi:hypothetical protein
MTINLGLSVGDVVNVSVLLQPTAAQQRNFGSLLILGDSGVIDTNSRYRMYTSLAAVAGDYPNNAPEYLAAAIAFGQNPQLQSLYIGAWARTATPGTLIGAPLSAAQQSISNFNSISTGGLNLLINGTAYNLTGLNFTACTSLTAVAAVIQAALVGSANVIWNPTYSYFQITSTTTGISSSVVASAGSGVDISLITNLNSSVSGTYNVVGIAAETPLVCVTLLAAMSNAWYGVMFAASVQPQDSDYVAVAGLIQGLTVSRIFGVCTQEGAALNPSLNTDIASQLQALGYLRTFAQYSSSTPYAQAAIFGDAFTVNFNGSSTLYTLKFKQEAGVAAETLTETQAAALTAKNCNVFVNYNNNTAILQQGTMANGTFFDIVHGTDWLQNAIQTAIYNALYTVGTKIPQTDAGVTTLVNVVTGQLEQSVTNGLVAPGVWQGPPIGAVVTGQTLSKGYYIYAPPVATQSQAARAARQAPVMQALIKLAGAIHSASLVLSVNS